MLLTHLARRQGLHCPKAGVGSTRQHHPPLKLARPKALHQIIEHSLCRGSFQISDLRRPNSDLHQILLQSNFIGKLSRQKCTTCPLERMEVDAHLSMTITCRDNLESTNLSTQFEEQEIWVLPRLSTTRYIIKTKGTRELHLARFINGVAARG